MVYTKNAVISSAPLKMLKLLVWQINHVDGFMIGIVMIQSGGGVEVQLRELLVTKRLALLLEDELQLQPQRLHHQW
jgi:hypothetical protein